MKATSRVLPHARPRARVALASLALIVTPGLALADTVLPSVGPLPFDRPHTAASAAAIDAAITTGAVAGQAAVKAGKLATGGSVTQLKNGLDALSSGDIARARLVRNNLPASSLDRAILMWAIATSGADGVSSGEIADAAYALSGWPGMARLRTASERAMYRENPGPRTVLSAFGNSQPQTIEGAILLARAHLATGNTAQARAALARFWRTEKLDAKEEQAIIREFGKVIPAADHRFRMERMLYAERISPETMEKAYAGVSFPGLDLGARKAAWARRRSRDAPCHGRHGRRGGTCSRRGRHRLRLRAWRHDSLRARRRAVARRRA